MLEESIESFLRQDYPNRELIVLNDAPGQTLICNSQGVRVINMHARFRTLGAKWNGCVMWSKGELLTEWHDDDISLPWRLSQSVEGLGDKDWWTAGHWWYLQGNNPPVQPQSMGPCQPQAIYRRSAWELVGGYEDVATSYYDQIFCYAIRNCGGTWGHATEMPQALWPFIYRIGYGRLQQSHASPRKSWPDNAEYKAGVYCLRPHWYRDYLTLTNKAINDGSRR